MHWKTLTVLVATLVAVVFALVTSAAPRAASGGLVAADGFDEGSGTGVHDAGATPNTGAARDTTWSPTGKFGGGVALNRAARWGKGPAPSSLDLPKGVT